jgi:hypothetical protein
MLRTFTNQGVGVRPEWVSDKLHFWYWQLRVERPKGAKRRRLYRYIAKERLRLVELGIDAELIRLTCRYLSSYAVVGGDKMIFAMENPPLQMCFDFSI